MWTTYYSNAVVFVTLHWPVVTQPDLEPMACIPVKSTKSESSHDLDESHNIHNVQAGSDLDLDSTTTTFSHRAAADIFFLPSLISAQMNRCLCYAKSVTFGAASQSCGPRSLSTLVS